MLKLQSLQLSTEISARANSSWDFVQDNKSRKLRFVKLKYLAKDIFISHARLEIYFQNIDGSSHNSIKVLYTFLNSSARITTNN